MNNTATSALRKRPRRLTAVLSVAASLVLLTASPAAAVGNTGAGTGGTGQEDSITYGDDYGTTENPFCLEVTASSYSATFANTSVFNADDGQTDATYTGSATLTFSTTETYFVGPEGTYTAATFQNGCDETTLGDPIAASVSVSGGNTTAGIVCGPDTAQYSRVLDAITLTWVGDCTVYDSATTDVATTPSTLDHRFEATLNPCFNPPDPCTSSTITLGTWDYPDPL